MREWAWQGRQGAVCIAAASSSSPALRGGSSEGMDASGLPEDALYLFDTLGWIKIEGALTAAEVAKLNGALEHKLAQAGLDEFPESESPQSLINGQIVAPLAGAPLPGQPEGRHTRQEPPAPEGRMLEWEQPWCEPFRELLCHPNVAPSLNLILGEGYRLVSPSRPPFAPHPSLALTATPAAGPWARSHRNGRGHGRWPAARRWVRAPGLPRRRASLHVPSGAHLHGPDGCRVLARRRGCATLHAALLPRI